MVFGKFTEALHRWNEGRPERKRRRQEAHRARIRHYEAVAEEHRDQLGTWSPYLRRRDE